MSYWELSEKERAALTEEQVEAFADNELMHAGVLKPAPLVLLDEAPLPEPDATVYRTKLNFYSHALAFGNADDALAHASKAIGWIDTSYIGGTSVDVLKDVGRDHHLAEEVRIYSEKRIAEARAALEKAGAARQENERRRRTHDEEQAKAKRALEGMWEDWYRCLQLASETRRVLETFEEYKRLAKDDDAAMVFLRKTFGVETVERSMGW